MRRILASLVITLGLGLTSLGLAQQGGGFGGGQGGTDQRQTASTGRSIDQGISIYLNDQEVKNILTPGEFSEWKLTLKPGQVVVSEARSDAFDPALQILDASENVLSSNDDRYPGDQRPLLLWRCEKEGTYSMRVRCFHDKSGGQFFIRYRTYDTVDLSAGTIVEQDVETNRPFLLRVPMKTGQIKDVVADFGGPKNYLYFQFNAVITPSGLPETSPSLSGPLSPAIRALIAPIPGDYYLMETPSGGPEGKARVRVGTRDILPAKLTKDGALLVGTAKTNLPAIWELPVKTGDLLEVSTPDLYAGCNLLISEAPDFSKFDASKPESNPYYPQEKPVGVNPESAVNKLPARDRDSRIAIFRARRDTTLWVATDGVGAKDKTFSLRVGPAAADLTEGKINTGKLRIGCTDYWAFDAKVGDVMTLSTTATGFAQQVEVLDPDLEAIRQTTAALDQTSDKWQMIVQKPGRYLVDIACLGYGGGGDYSLSRTVYHAKVFSRAEAAKGEIAPGQVQVWRFTAQPKDPIFLHWRSSIWAYDIDIYDDKGRSAELPREAIGSTDTYGILNVTEPRTYVIVLTGRDQKATYSIELGQIPGYKPDGTKG